MPSKTTITYVGKVIGIGIIGGTVGFLIGPIAALVLTFALRAATEDSTADGCFSLIPLFGALLGLIGMIIGSVAGMTAFVIRKRRSGGSG